MKNLYRFLSFLFVAAFATVVQAQAPQRMNYQGVARNLAGDPIANQMISLRLSILTGGASGSSAYTETQSVNTNQFGLFSTQLGAGTVVSGNLAAINWQVNTYFLRVEIDPTGGTAFTLLGQPTQLVSVPYALAAQHAHTASNFSGNITLQGDVTGLNNNTNVTRLRGRPLAGTPPQNGQILRWDGTEWAPSPDNDGQQLQLNGNILSLTNANSVTLPISLDAQTLTLSGNELSISNGNTIVLPTGTGGTNYTAGAGINISGNTINNAGDLSTTNEIQNLSLAGNQLTLSQGGGSVTLPTGTTYTAGTGISLAGNTVTNTGDLSNTNEIQAISIAGDVISLSNGGGSITLPPNSGTDSQTLSINGGDLSISNGNTVTLPDASTTNEIQNLSLTGNQLTLSQGGGSVSLPTGTTYTAGTGISLTGNTVTNTGDLSNTNEIQAISIAGDVISLSNGGGSITLPPNSGTDSQTLSINGGDLSISNGNTITLPDASTTNEIQNLSLAGNQLTLSQGGGSVTLPTGTTYTAGTGISLAGNTVTNTGDLSNTNEIQAISLTGNELTLSQGGGTVTLPTGTTYTAGTGISLTGNTVTNTGDLSNTNEIQGISLTGNQLTLSQGGGSVTLPTGTTYTAGSGISLTGNTVTNTGDLSNTNEIQAISLTGNQLTLSQGGGSVTLPTGTTYTAGTGISLSGNAITNTGDTNPADDITTSSIAAGHISGTFNALQILPNVVGSGELQNGAVTMPKIAQSGATNGQVIKWNGTAWAPGTDNSGGTSQWNTLANDTIVNANNGLVKMQNRALIAGNFSSGQFNFPGLTLSNTSAFGASTIRFQRQGINRYWEQSASTDQGFSSMHFNMYNDTVTNQVLELNQNGTVRINPNFAITNPYVLAISNISAQNYGLFFRNFNGSNTWELTATGTSNQLRLYGPLGTQLGNFDGTSGQYTAVSDARLKTNVEPLYSVLDKLANLEAKRYAFKHTNEQQKSIGFLAQDLQKVFPELVHESTDDRNGETILTVEYGTLGVLALQAIKEQQGTIEALKQENAALQAQMKALESNQKALDARLKALENK